MCRHVAFIPAREGSQGFKHKNRRFFENTANFVDALEWIDKVTVSTDDSVVDERARRRGYVVHKRPPNLAGPAVSIKTVIRDVVKNLNLDESIILWLFYLPVLYKNRGDFDSARQIIEQTGVASLCSFIAALTHPFTCWRYDTELEEIFQYIPNDIFRRQDLPDAWMHYHYVCCFKVRELPELNGELLNKNTHPMFLSKEVADMLIEVDTPQDHEKWLAIAGETNEIR